MIHNLNQTLVVTVKLNLPGNVSCVFKSEFIFYLKIKVFVCMCVCSISDHACYHRRFHI